MGTFIRNAAAMLAFMFVLCGVLNAQQTEVWKKMNLASYDVYYKNNLPSTLFIEIASLAPHILATIPDFVINDPNQPVSIYIYPDKESYVNGQFHPPAWSKGIQINSKSTVVAYLTPNRQDLLATLAHELTHMYVQKFFLKKDIFPPIWIDEGFAVLVEDTLFSRNDGPWTQIEKATDKTKMFEFNVILSEGPGGRDQAGINTWYIQAFSLIKFLKSKGNFMLMSFCKTFRDTQDLPQALKKTYGFKNLDAFEAAWKKSSAPTVHMQTTQFQFQGVQSTRPDAITIGSY